MNVLTLFNSRRLAVCNCNCEHYRTKFYFGIWCQNKVIIIIIIISFGYIQAHIRLITHLTKSCNTGPWPVSSLYSKLSKVVSSENLIKYVLE